MTNLRESTAALLSELSRLASPSGREEAVDALIVGRLEARGRPRRDAAGNLVLRLAGRGERGLVALSAHKDEIAAVVKRVEDDGRVRLVATGDAHPWIWGEAPLALLGDRDRIDGVLSFGSRHVSPESDQHGLLEERPVRWRDAWVETKRSVEELRQAGVRPGTRAVLGDARREPVRLGAGGAWIACPALDDKIAIAVLLRLTELLEAPAGDVDLVFSAREEVGCHGIRHYARRTEVDDLVAVEVAPAAEEYGIEATPDPVLIVGDALTVLHDGLGQELAAAAEREGIALQHAMLARYGSDASDAYRGGLVGRAACLAAAADNTHGLEIAHLDAVEGCARVLAAWLA